nr:hypothetical protein CFP56_76342 [Quercus suber]
MFDKASLTDGETKFIMDNLRELSHEFEKYMMATNGVEDVGKECPQDLAHDEVQPNLDGEKSILDPPHMSIAYPMIGSTRIHQQIQVEKMRSGKYATSSQAPQASSMIQGNVQSLFIPLKMSIVYPMFSSIRMNQEIQVEKMRRSGKDATSSQAPQVSSMIHGGVQSSSFSPELFNPMFSHTRMLQENKLLSPFNQVRYVTLNFLD